MGRVLTDPAVEALIDRHGRALVADAARLAIDEARQRILAAPLGSTDAPSVGALVAAVAAHAERMSRASLRRVLNGTGVVLHTNLGRAPLAEAARSAALEAMGACSVELDLETGRRGKRDEHVGPLAAELTGAEAATAVNNCAGATLLMLAAVARGGEVPVSRGELVEIGGSFRVPDIMAESGARLVEVGTTNKTYARDYLAAANEATRALLVVHRSNFALVGFDHTPSPDEMVDAAKTAGVPLLVDLGSGLLAADADLDAEGRVAAEPRPKDWIAAGADLVAFSGDKLLGGPQAGLLVGRRALVDRCRRHPLARALRLDKLGLAALAATLRLQRSGRADRIPAVRMMAASPDEVRDRAERLVEALAGAGDPTLVASRATPGGGALPLVELPSWAVAVGPPGGGAEALAARLRAQEPALVGRILDERLAFDARTLTDDEIPIAARGIRRALTERADIDVSGAIG